MKKYITMAVLACCACAAEAKITDYQLNADMPGYAWDFSYVQLTDIHIGFGTTDYASPGYDDTLDGASEGKAERNLREAVEWINANREKLRIKFVAVTGDITHHAQRSEFLKAREILNGLSVPYVPIMGNHDVWPFSKGGDAAPGPFGDSYYKKTFSGEFARLASFFQDWTAVPCPEKPAEADSTARYCLQNYAFRFGGYVFVMPDIIGRSRKPGKGSPVEVDLFETGNGTLNWLKTYYAASNAPEKHLIVLAHYPLTEEEFGGERLFAPGQYAALSGMLAGGKKAGLWNSGHLHRNKEYFLKSDGKDIAPVAETGTNREKMTLRIIKVWDKAK
ncbi:MAG: hypothetical protein GX410_07075 [Elusimicrobia bacterium]|nr:hypothetical protein [Elusimicrobiota bacterium]